MKTTTTISQHSVNVYFAPLQHCSAGFGEIISKQNLYVIEINYTTNELGTHLTEVGDMQINLEIQAILFASQKILIDTVTVASLLEEDVIFNNY